MMGKGQDNAKNPTKHWLMVQVWRVQQIGGILSLVLMAIADAVLITNAVVWRVGNYYLTVVLLLILLGSIIFLFGWFWDRKAKMWREQMTVTVERNPYASLKFMPKEIIGYRTIYIPLMEFMAKTDAKNREILLHNAEVYRAWIRDGLAQDPELRKKVDEMWAVLNLKGGKI